MPGLIVMIWSATVSALPPPEIIKARNLEANIIAIGEVLKVSGPSSFLPASACFDLRINHVIKGFEQVKDGDLIKTNFILPLPSSDNAGNKAGIKSHHMDTQLVKVKAGQLVIVYLNPSKTNPGFFEPLLQGLSVILLEKP